MCSPCESCQEPRHYVKASDRETFTCTFSLNQKLIQRYSSVWASPSWILYQWNRSIKASETPKTFRLIDWVGLDWFEKRRPKPRSAHIMTLLLFLNPHARPRWFQHTSMIPPPPFLLSLKENRAAALWFIHVGQLTNIVILAITSAAHIHLKYLQKKCCQLISYD